jgi:hypothetical protein
MFCISCCIPDLTREDATSPERRGGIVTVIIVFLIFLTTRFEYITTKNAVLTVTLTPLRSGEVAFLRG